MKDIRWKKMLVQGNLSQLYFIIAMWMIKEKAKPAPIDRVSYTLRGGLSGANASATNCGPRAEPPIPTESIWVKRPSGEDGGLICNFDFKQRARKKKGQSRPPLTT